MGKSINSKSNPRIKLLRQLSSKKHRLLNQLFMVESLKIIHDAFISDHVWNELFISESFKKENQIFLSSIGRSLERDIYTIPDHLNREFSSLSTPSGICATYSLLDTKPNTKESIVYLNNISDPGNLGAIFRASLAFGFKNIIIDDKCADIYNPKTIQSARDSIFKVKISQDNERKLLNKLAKSMKIIVTDTQGDFSLKNTNSKDKYCIVFGNEANGVNQSIKDMAHYSLKVNISPDIESLNVLSAASIILHSLYVNK